MTEREKIIKVIDEWANKAVNANKFDGASVYNPHNAAELADALIAAGIGDVSKLKNHRVIAEYSLVPDDDNPYIIPNVPLRVTQLYSGEEVEKIVKEREEYKHRAARAERALKNACEDVKETVSFLIELSERVDGLRVEGYLPEESEPKAYINRAEKELAEEGNK